MSIFGIGGACFEYKHPHEATQRGVARHWAMQTGDNPTQPLVAYFFISNCVVMPTINPGTKWVAKQSACHLKNANETLMIQF